MISNLFYLFWNLIIVSLITVGGGSQPLLEHIAIAQKGWITAADFSAALTFGYITPGPAVLISATFIGYAVGGFLGAIVGTFGIFLMPWLLAVAAARVMNRFFHLPRVKGFMRGVQSAIAGLLVTTAMTVASPLDHRIYYAVIIILAFCAVTYTKTHRFIVLFVGFLINVLIIFVQHHS